MDLSDALDTGTAQPTQAGGQAWPGQPANPAWPGQPAQPTWPGAQPGMPAQPYWPGQPGQPNQPAWPGQPNQPAWPGQPNQPAWPGQPNQPAWPGQPNQPTAPGWPGPTPPTAPQTGAPLTVPYKMDLPYGIFDRLVITIEGQIKPNAKMFTIDLGRNRDIAFHFNPRFNEGGKKVIVRNSMIGDKWGKEERDSPFPFVPGQPFVLDFRVTPTEFIVAVNKNHLLQFKHRILELNQIKQITIYNDVILSSVNLESP